MDVAGWEELYRTGRRGSEDQPTQLLVETVKDLSPGNAIDLACGTGRNALFLADLGWDVRAVDASQTAIEKLTERAEARGVNVTATVSDLTSSEFAIPNAAFDLIVIAYYLQRDLFEKMMPKLRANGLILAIVHTPDPGEPPNKKRAAPGELRQIFADWDVLHYYEGPSRDPAHHRPVAEIVARKR